LREPFALDKRDVGGQDRIGGGGHQKSSFRSIDAAKVLGGDGLVEAGAQVYGDAAVFSSGWVGFASKG